MTVWTAIENALAAWGNEDCLLELRPGAEVIRIEAVWLAVEPLDMRAGTETALDCRKATGKCGPVQLSLVHSLT